MKTIIFLLALLPIFAMANHHEEKAAPSPYRHVVLFKFKDDAAKEQVAKIEKEFVALKKAIPTITDLEWGTNVSPENHDQGFTHCFIVSFKDKAGLEVYLPHEAHKSFGELLLPSLDKVLVIDFVPQK
ncbi:MAG: Dabb family protein [Verrucomicrobiaceae bacterium]